MNRAKKILAASAGSLVIGFVAYLAIGNLFLEPAKDRMAKAAELREKIRKAEDEKKKENQYRAGFAEITGETFGTDELKVSEELREHITDVVAASGMTQTSLSLKPVIGSRVPGVYKSLGWMVRVRGKLTNVVNFLYLMSREAHVHRLDNLVLTPYPSSGDIELQVMYATLVLEQPPTRRPSSSPTRSSKCRSTNFSRILQRGVLRCDPGPQHPVALHQGPDPAATAARFGRSGHCDSAQGTGRTPPAPSSKFRLVGLPALGGVPAVAVSDSSSGKTAWYKPGDTLAGGRIVMVDYRPMPKADRPHLQSESRLVLQVGYEYYAIELGADLA